MRYTSKQSSQEARAAAKYSRALRNARGASIPEFGAAFSAFVLFGCIPVLNLGILPVRYAVAHEILNSQTHRVAMCDKITDAVTQSDAFASNPQFRAFGIKVESSQLAIKIVSKVNSTKQIKLPATSGVPTNWLPDSPSGPFYYYLEQATQVSIAPLLSASGPSTPGLTTPVTITITTDAEWENQSRDPNSQTQAFYITE